MLPFHIPAIQTNGSVAALFQGQEVKIEITGINHRGEGVGRHEGMVVFIPGTVPGERVFIRVEDVRRSFARGMLLNVLSPSAGRVQPGCALAESCGGCALQHIDYHAQLQLKTNLLRQTLARSGGITDNVVRDIIGMPAPWHYRNNVQFKVRRNAAGVQLGFYQRESHSFVTFNEKLAGLCLLAHRELNRAAAMVLKFLNEAPPVVPLPDEVALRRGSSGEIMVVLTTLARDAKGKVKYSRGRYDLLAEKIAVIAGVASVVEHERPVNKKPGGRYHTLFGRDYIVDELDGLKFRISAPSFYQVNPEQTAVLYRKTLEYCGLRGVEQLADAYCGVGTIALYLARRASEVRGYELVPRAVEDARANADLNGIKNARFYAGAVEKVLPEQVAVGYRPGVVVLDPPRAGCRPEVLQAVAASDARRVVYVSCDPATLARDIKRLTGLGFTPAEVQPVDMFPHTPHVECVVRMERV